MRFTAKFHPNSPPSISVTEPSPEPGRPKKNGIRFHVAGPARRDIAAILKRSLREFGMEASLRYRALIRQALLDIEADHERPGSIARPELMVEKGRGLTTSR